MWTLVCSSTVRRMPGLLDLVRVSSMELPVLLLTYLTLVSPLPKDRAVN